MDGTVYVQLHHPRYNKEISLSRLIRPLAATNQVTCHLAGEKPSRFAENAKILNIILTDGLSVFLLPARIQNIQKDHFTIEMPDKAYILGTAAGQTLSLSGCRAELVQNGFQAQGRLTDFSSLGPSPSRSARGSRFFSLV